MQGGLLAVRMLRVGVERLSPFPFTRAYDNNLTCYVPHEQAQTVLHARWCATGSAISTGMARHGRVLPSSPVAAQLLTGLRAANNCTVRLPWRTGGRGEHRDAMEEGEDGGRQGGDMVGGDGERSVRREPSTPSQAILNVSQQSPCHTEWLVMQVPSSAVPAKLRTSLCEAVRSLQASLVTTRQDCANCNMSISAAGSLLLTAAHSICIVGSLAGMRARECGLGHAGTKHAAHRQRHSS